MRLPINHFRCVWSIRNHFPGFRMVCCFNKPPKNSGRIHAMRRIMRTSVNTTWFLMIQTQIARSGLELHARNSSARVRRVIQFNRERMHIDISIRTIVGALSATDTPVLDDDLQRIAAANGADRATNHTQRIAALPARGGHQISIESQSITNKPADAIVSIGASPHALVAAGAAIKVENQQTLRFHQALVEKTDRRRHRRLGSLGAGSAPCAQPPLLRACAGFPESDRASTGNLPR